MSQITLRSRPWTGWIWLLLFISSTSWAASVNFGWDAENGVAGYVIYYGTTSGDYTNEIDTGTNAVATINSLQPGLTYYFAIASFDTNGVESPLSAEISYLVPGLLVLTPGVNPGDPLALSFPESPGDWYEVQSSPDLVVWTTFWSTNPAVINDWVQILLFDTQATPQEFFRLILH